jgi:hypothetical protein
MGGSIARYVRPGRTPRRAGIIAGLALVLTVCLAAAASAAPTFTWSGAQAVNNPDWSVASNWASDTAPAPSEVIGALDFPAVGNSACTPIPELDLCFFRSFNNVSGLTAESIQIDDGEDYQIAGKPITLGSGGLSAAPATETSELTLAELDLPITLAAAQTWSVEGKGPEPENGLYLGGGVSGSSADTLDVDLGNRGELFFGADNELGPVSVNGSEADQPGFRNGVFGLFGGDLDLTNRNPVSLNHVFFYGAGGLGALSTTGDELYLAVGGSSSAPEGTLRVASASFDPASEISFVIPGSGDTPGSDYSRLFSGGAVSLGAAGVSVRRTESCSTLPPGRTYTFLSSAGPLSGAFGNAPEGGEIPIIYPTRCSDVSQSLRLAYHESGSTQTVTGTVIAGPESTTTLSASSSEAVTNQRVTLTATVEATEGNPSGTVEFLDNGAAISGCSAQPVSGITAVCQTTFAAAGSPARLQASFTPAAGFNLQGSTSATDELAVAAGGSTTALQLSGATASIGAGVTYTATVRPADPGPIGPSGVVEFLDNGAPIAACANQPLAGTPATATCQVSYSEAGGPRATPATSTSSAPPQRPRRR